MTERTERGAVEPLRAQLLRAFPPNVHPDAEPAIQVVPLADYSPVGLIHESNNREWPPVTFGGEVVEVPDRIYNEYPGRALGHSRRRAVRPSAASTPATTMATFVSRPLSWH